MRVIDKPWGKEELLEVNEKYMVKRLTMNKGHRCSIQYHNRKTETIYALSGLLKISHGAASEQLMDVVLPPGEYMTITPGVVHRMEAVETAVYLEASTPELDDVVRLADDYNRD